MKCTLYFLVLPMHESLIHGPVRLPARLVVSSDACLQLSILGSLDVEFILRLPVQQTERGVVIYHVCDP